MVSWTFCTRIIKTYVLQGNRIYSTVVGFTLKAKLVSSKHLIQVHLETLSRFVENMASHFLTKFITWDKKSCQSRSLRSLESWNRCTCSMHIVQMASIFVFGQVCSQVWCSLSLAANLGFFELQKFPWLPSKVEVGTFYPFTLKEGYNCKDPYIILEALMWSQQQVSWVRLVSSKQMTSRMYIITSIYIRLLS